MLDIPDDTVPPEVEQEFEEALELEMEAWTKAAIEEFSKEGGDEEMETVQ